MLCADGSWRVDVAMTGHTIKIKLSSYVKSLKKCNCDTGATFLISCTNLFLVGRQGWK